MRPDSARFLNFKNTRIWPGSVKTLPVPPLQVMGYQIKQSDPELEENLAQLCEKLRGVLSKGYKTKGDLTTIFK